MPKVRMARSLSLEINRDKHKKRGRASSGVLRFFRQYERVVLRERIEKSRSHNRGRLNSRCIEDVSPRFMIGKFEKKRINGKQRISARLIFTGSGSLVFIAASDNSVEREIPLRLIFISEISFFMFFLKFSVENLLTDVEIFFGESRETLPVSNFTRAFSSEFTSWDSKNRPFLPSLMKSKAPPAFRAITGHPAARASTGAMPNGSFDGKMKALAIEERTARSVFFKNGIKKIFSDFLAIF